MSWEERSQNTENLFANWSVQDQIPQDSPAFLGNQNEEEVYRKTKKSFKMSYHKYVENSLFLFPFI